MSTDDFNWDQLLVQIQDRSVVPVLGNELLLGPVAGGGDPAGVQMVRALCKALKIDVPKDASVREVANHYVALQPDGRKTLPNFLRRYALPAATELPSALKLLAEIEDFPLYVSTTPDDLLARCLAEVRLKGQGSPANIYFSPQDRPTDLQAPLRDLTLPTVFYPFGGLKGVALAATEEDVLDFVRLLFAERGRLPVLMSAIENANLLFIGCNFPDWLTRFWMRALRGGSLWDGGLRYLADSAARREEPLVLFFNRTDVKVSHMDADAFVGHLHGLWTATREVPPPPPSAGLPVPAENPWVFISYASEDYAAAKNFREGLVRNGIDAWFDENQIAAGQPLRARIVRNIQKSSVFVPIISQNAASRGEGWFREEWKTALERAGQIDLERIPFVQPIIVDDLAPDANGVPLEFWKLRCERLKGGTVSEAIVRSIKECIRQAQL